MRGWKSVEGPGVVVKRRRDVRRWAKRPFKSRIWGAGCQSGGLGLEGSVYAMRGEGNGEVLRARQRVSF